MRLVAMVVVVLQPRVEPLADRPVLVDLIFRELREYLPPARLARIVQLQGLARRDQIAQHLSRDRHVHRRVLHHVAGAREVRDVFG